MNLRVNARHIEVTDDLRAHIEKRISKLARLLPHLDDVQVELSEAPTRAPSDRFTCQLAIWDHRNVLRAEETSVSVRKSIDAVVDKLCHQIEKVRGRQKDHQRPSLVESLEAALADNGAHDD